MSLLHFLRTKNGEVPVVVGDGEIDFLLFILRLYAEVGGDVRQGFAPSSEVIIFACGFGFPTFGIVSFLHFLCAEDSHIPVVVGDGVINGFVHLFVLRLNGEVALNRREVGVPSCKVIVNAYGVRWRQCRFSPVHSLRRFEYGIVPIDKGYLEGLLFERACNSNRSVDRQ